MLVVTVVDGLWSSKVRVYGGVQVVKGYNDYRSEEFRVK